MNRIISLMQRMGYDISDRGICAGITQMWLQAWFTGGEEAEMEFFERIAYLLNKPATESECEIKRAQKKLKNNQPISVTERKTLETLAFFDGIFLYQNPALRKAYFVKAAPIAQHDIVNIAKSLSPKVLEDKGGIDQVLNLPIVGNRDELQKNFDALKEIIKEHAGNVAINLSSGQHRIGMRYDAANDQWIIVDPSALANILFLEKGYTIHDAINNMKCDHENVARHIIGALAFEKDIVFNLKVLTTNKVHASVETQLDEMRKNNLHSLTKEQAKKNNRNITLSHISSLNGHTDFIEKYLEFGHDINIPTLDSESLPLHYAANGNQIKAVTLLLAQKDKNKVNINARDIDNNTASHIAVQNGFSDMLKVLAQYNADFTSVNNEGNSPLSLAFKMKDWEMIFTMLNAIKNPVTISKINFSKLLKNIKDKEFYNQFIKYAQSLQENEKNTLIKNVLQNKNAIGLIFKKNFSFKHTVKLFMPLKTNYLNKISREFSNQGNISKLKSKPTVV